MFFTEIAVASIAGARPWELEASFDENIITNKELERGVELRGESEPFFVETWHIGNLAYARTRNPSVARKYEPQIVAHVREFEPRVYFLDLQPELLGLRTKYFMTERDKEKAIVFYSKVRGESYRVFDDLQVRPIVLDTSVDVEIVFQRLLRNEQGHCSFGLAI